MTEFRVTMPRLEALERRLHHRQEAPSSQDPKQPCRRSSTCRRAVNGSEGIMVDTLNKHRAQSLSECVAFREQCDGMNLSYGVRSSPGGVRVGITTSLWVTKIMRCHTIAPLSTWKSIVRSNFIHALCQECRGRRANSPKSTLLLFKRAASMRVFLHSALFGREQSRSKCLYRDRSAYDSDIADSPYRRQSLFVDSFHSTEGLDGRRCPCLRRGTRKSGERSHGEDDEIPELSSLNVLVKCQQESSNTCLAKEEIRAR